MPSETRRPPGRLHPSESAKNEAEAEKFRADAECARMVAKAEVLKLQAEARRADADARKLGAEAEEQTARLVKARHDADRSKMSKVQIANRWRRRDWWISAQDSLKHGFIDEVR